MKKTFIRILAMTLCFVIFTVMVASCNSSGGTPSSSNATVTAPSSSASEAPKEPTAQKVTLSLLANQDWVTKPYMKTAWKNYEDATGNTLDIQAVPIDSGEQIMKTKFATGEIPDIFMHFGGYSLTPFKPEENFVDFTDAAWVSDIQGYVLDQTKFNDRVYGLPHWEASISGMIYNKEIFSSMGIEVPTTQTEFESACEKIKAGGITPIYLAFKDVWPLLYQFALDPVVKDSAVLNRLNSNQIKYADIPEFTDMMNWYKTMADKGYLGERFTTNTWDGAPSALGEGTYAMMYVWDSWVDSDLEVAYPGQKDNFGLMPIFLGTPEQGTYEGPNCCITFVYKNGKNVESAIDFINFLAAPENYNEAFRDYGTAPVFKGQTTNATTKLYTEARESIEKVGNSSIAVNSIIGFTQVDAAKYIQEYMLGTKSLEECIAGMDDERIGAAKAQQVPGF